MTRVRDNRVARGDDPLRRRDPFAAPFAMPSDGPPLLAVQGTADTINPPGDTYAFYRHAARPNILLKLLGAGHQPPTPTRDRSSTPSSERRSHFSIGVSSIARQHSGLYSLAAAPARAHH